MAKKQLLLRVRFAWWFRTIYWPWLVLRVLVYCLFTGKKPEWALDELKRVALSAMRTKVEAVDKERACALDA